MTLRFCSVSHEMALSTGPYVPIITTRSLNLLSTDETKVRCITFEDTFNLTNSVATHASTYIPTIQGAFPPSATQMGGAPFTLVLGFDAILGTSTTITPATGTDGTISSYVVWENNISATYTPGTVSKLQTLNITVYSSDNTAHNAQTFQTIVTYPQWTLGYNMTITTTTNTNDTLALVGPSSWAYCIDNLSPKTYWEFSVVSCTNYDNNTYRGIRGHRQDATLKVCYGNFRLNDAIHQAHMEYDANGVYQGNDIFTGYRLHTICHVTIAAVNSACRIHYWNRVQFHEQYNIFLLVSVRHPDVFVCRRGVSIQYSKRHELYPVCRCQRPEKHGEFPNPNGEFDTHAQRIQRPVLIFSHMHVNRNAWRRKTRSVQESTSLH